MALCTLWTPKEHIVEQLDKNSFCLAGQLYSRRGLNFIVRNLLAKPSIQYLIVCGNSLTDTDKALGRFFEKGEVEEGAVDPQVPKEALMGLRERLELINLSGVLKGKEISEVISGLEKKRATAEPQTFPEPSYRDEESFPTDPSVFKVRGNYIGEVWLRALKHVLKFGRKQERIGGQKVKSIHNLAVVIEKENPREPKIYPYFNFEQKDVDQYVENFLAKELKGHSYSYGSRLQDYRDVDQIKIMKEKLARFSGEEGALAVLWDPTADNFPPNKDTRHPESASRRNSGSDASNCQIPDRARDGGMGGKGKKRLGKAGDWSVPCLNLVQGQVYGEKLCLTAYFRAHDIFNAWPRNLFALRKLQCQLADETNYKLGTLTVFSQFAWISLNDLPLAKGVVKNNYVKNCVWDPRGNFVIDVKEEEIIAIHLSPEGKKLQEFSIDGQVTKAAVKLCGEIIAELSVSDLNHAADLGMELAKAEIAVKNDLKYEQDRPLKL